MAQTGIQLALQELNYSAQDKQNQTTVEASDFKDGCWAKIYDDENDDPNALITIRKLTSKSTTKKLNQIKQNCVLHKI